MVINYGSCAVCFVLNTIPSLIGDWEYIRTPNEDTVTLNRYMGNDTDVIVPSEIHIDIVSDTIERGSINDNVTEIKDSGSVSDPTIITLREAGNIA